MKKTSIKNPFSNKGTALKKVYKSLAYRITSWDLKKIARNMSILAVLVALVGGYLWYSRIYMTNERKFWMAIENSMSTQSVTRTTTTGGTGNKVVQDQQFFYSPQMASRSHVTFEQKSSSVDTAVETEGVAFPDSQYSRYTTFRTNQKKSDGTVPNLDSILDKWEGTKVSDEELESSKLNYVSENVTLAIFGNFGAKFRHDTLKALKEGNTYSIDFTNVVPDTVDGRKVLRYPVNVNLFPYTTQLQKAFVEAGYGDFPPLNPENYKDGSQLSAQITVDAKTNTIVGIQFGSREETYRGYGIGINVVAPKTDFNSGELEQKVQQEIETAL